MIAFCITCKGRVEHFKKTFPVNYAGNSSGDVKFILLDYNSKDDLIEYVQKAYSPLIEYGGLVVYSFRDEGPFRMAHAKNLAHRLGILEGADILVNLDADNFTGVGFANYITEQFKQDNVYLAAGIVKGKGKKLRGCSGRIAVSKQAFLLTGGYDEKYDTWAPDDKDFNARLKRMGFTSIEIDRKYLEALPHSDHVRFKEYPHVQVSDLEEEMALTNISTAVVNAGNIGTGTVYKNFDYTKPIVIDKVPSRIFGIGMHKTATNSLNTALRTLGIDSVHWRSPAKAKQIWTQMTTEGRSIEVEKHQAVCDLPITLLYKELDKAYPGSKFILTTRTEQNWVSSIINHWNPVRNSWRNSWDTDCFTHKIHSELYGMKYPSAKQFLETYKNHNSKVLDYFKTRPDDLLVMDMDNAAGWKELCKFLEMPIPAVEYPKEYITQ